MLKLIDRDLKKKIGGACQKVLIEDEKGKKWMLKDNKGNRALAEVMSFRIANLLNLKAPSTELVHAPSALGEQWKEFPSKWEGEYASKQEWFDDLIVQKKFEPASKANRQSQKKKRQPKIDKDVVEEYNSSLEEFKPLMDFFDYIISNHDRRGANYGILETSSEPIIIDHSHAKPWDKEAANKIGNKIKDFSSEAENNEKLAEAMQRLKDMKREELIELVFGGFSEEYSEKVEPLLWNILGRLGAVSALCRKHF